MKKIKILTLSDYPLFFTGVGHMTRNMIEGLLKTGRYSIISLGGSKSHEDYTPKITPEYGEDWKIYPVDGFGSPEVVRSILWTERPDVVWFMTDPHKWEWLWQMEDEIRALVPMVYYHVWDNLPYPKFNKVWYDSTDVVATASKLTSDIVQVVAPTVEEVYIPHAVDTDIFKRYLDNERDAFRNEHMSQEKDKFIFFWNNRNGRRKHPATLIYWFKEFLDIVGHDEACLLMHTAPRDPTGNDLEYIIRDLGLNNGQVMISPAKYEEEHMAMLYNMADCVINISDAEGFGLSTLEALSCEVPIIATMTGGLREQVQDEINGIGIEPSSKMLIGTEKVKAIYEDRISKDDFLNALETMYRMDEGERREWGRNGRKHVLKHYSLRDYVKSWDKLINDVHARHGSWDTRKEMKRWNLVKI
tara:strand:- start:66 stop:1313 length:1248 start_codon:yes stop_codon:yes gene_type:complete